MNKILKYIVYSFLPLAMIACSEETDDDMEFPKEEINVAEGLDGNGGSITINLTENGIPAGLWENAVSSNHWLQVVANKEENKLDLTFAENLWQYDRTAKINISGVAGAVDLLVTQKSIDFDENHKYKLPVVFHVLYNDESNEKEYVRPGHLEKVLEGVNKIYEKNQLPITFVLAEEDNEGKAMPEKGISREKISNIDMNPEEFMASGDAKYKEMLWDNDKYINVMIYTYTPDQQYIIGISQFPVFIEPYTLDGCTMCPSNGNPYDFPYPHCICINNNYIYEMQEEGGDYNDKDITVTLAHELGHFLALYHAFNENKNAPKLDTDYCSDTKPYNRDQYMISLNSWIGKYGKIGPIGSEGYEANVMRNNSMEPERFRSTNIMDYTVSDANEFTAEQKERIIYSLHHSFFLPGPKDYSESPLYQEKGITRKNATNTEWAIKPNITKCDTGIH